VGFFHCPTVGVPRNKNSFWYMLLHEQKARIDVLCALQQRRGRRIWDWEAPPGRHQSWQRLAGTLGPSSRCLLASFPFSVSIFISSLYP
jgi:hypothetical protein